MEGRSRITCLHCDRTSDEFTLRKCPICFKHFCEDHAFQMSGRTFCGKHCAEYFFFTDPEEKERKNE